MRRSLLLAVLAAMPATPALAASESRPAQQVSIPLDDRAIRAAGIVVSRLESENGGNDQTFPGNVLVPPHQIRVVAAPTGGLIESLFVSQYDEVEKGQRLALIRSPQIIEAQRGYLTSLADDNLAQDRLRRSRMLFERNALAERDLRVAETEAVNARFRFEEQAQVLSLLGLPDEEIATLKQTRRLVPALTIVAPQSGAVTTRHVSPGERVDASAPLFTVAHLNPLWVNMQVPVSRLNLMSIGSAVVLPAHGATGRVIRIGRTVDPATQSVAVVAEFPVERSDIRPGLTLAVSVRVEQNGSAQFLAPRGSVVRHRDRSWIFVRSGTGFSATPVDVVSESTRGVTIRADLPAGAEVATRGIAALLAELSELDAE